MRAFVGIDLGTTNSTCTFLQDLGEGKVNCYRLPIRQAVFVSEEKVEYVKEDILPSCVIISEQSNKVFCGRMDSENESSDYYPINNIKTKLSDTLWSVATKEKVLTPVLISSIILKTIYESLKNTINIENIVSIVITIPASFSSQMRRSTIDAATLAGFDKEKITLLDEPIAAILSKYDSETQSFLSVPDKTPLLIFDMGGGTTDVSIIELNNEEKSINVKACSRYNELGGSDFDLELAALLLKIIKTKIDFDPILEQLNLNRNFARKFSNKLIEKGKQIKESINKVLEKINLYNIKIDELLSQVDDSTQIEVALNDLPALSIQSVQVKLFSIIECLLPYISYEKRDVVNRNIFRPIEEVLKRSSIKLSDLKNKYIIGGSASLSLIPFSLSSRFTIIDNNFEPKFSISEGAAKFAYLNNSDKWIIQERTTEKIFLHSDSSTLIEVLSENMQIPGSLSEPLIPTEENNTIYFEKGVRKAELEFYQGIAKNDPGLSLIHKENIRFNSEIFSEAKMTDIKGSIDKNKVYRFKITISEEEEPVFKKEIVFGQTYKYENELIQQQNLAGLEINYNH